MTVKQIEVKVEGDLNDEELEAIVGGLALPALKRSGSISINNDQTHGPIDTHSTASGSYSTTGNGVTGTGTTGDSTTVHLGSVSATDTHTATASGSASSTAVAGTYGVTGSDTINFGHGTSVTATGAASGDVHVGSTGVNGGGDIHGGLQNGTLTLGASGHANLLFGGVGGSASVSVTVSPSVVNGVNALSHGAQTTAQHLGHQVGTSSHELFNNSLSDAHSAWNTVENGAQNAINTVENGAKTAANDVKNFFSNI